MRVFGFTPGVSQLSRTAGLNPCLSERSTPGKMPTLTCSLKKKTTTCIKSNVRVTLVLFIPLNSFSIVAHTWSFFLQFTMSSPSALMLTMNFGELLFQTWVRTHTTLSPLCIYVLFCSFSEDVLPSIHADPEYPCELVGTWNTWYGEQDQAGKSSEFNITTREQPMEHKYRPMPKILKRSNQTRMFVYKDLHM